MAKNEPPAMLNLTQFSSLEDAMEQVKPGDRYTEVGKLIIPVGEGGMPMTVGVAFWFSMITRCEGLHGAIAREIGNENPHATFPLIRAFAEAVVLLIYVIDHPDYIHTLTARAKELPKDGPKRKSIQALISYASTHVPGMKEVYAELSEASHFGATAMWAAHTIEGEDDSSLQTSWTSYPRWRSEDQALIACAQTLELADAIEHFLREFFERHIRLLEGT